MKYWLIFLTLVGFFLNGCSVTDIDPRPLGYEIVRAIKNDDFEAYSSFFITLSDKMFLISNEYTDKEQSAYQMSMLQKGKKEIAFITEKRLNHFYNISSEGNWEQAKVEKILVGKMRRMNNVVRCNHITVQFQGKVLPDLLINDLVLLGNTWKLNDDTPLSFKSRI
jgi:hypothetical protein